jgi:uncharacterized protein (TIGR02118 family)
MIKIMFCLRRLPSLSPEEFQLYWRETHAPLVQRVAPLLGIRRYVQSQRFADAALDGGNAVRGGAAIYDGVAELWFDSEESARRSGTTPEERDAARLLLEDEQRFIDLPNSPLFWVREHEVIPYREKGGS